VNYDFGIELSTGTIARSVQTLERFDERVAVFFVLARIISRCSS
jgi:hypothetical protein